MGSDPTGGNVNYVSREVATGAAQLAYVQDDNTTVLAVDNTSTVPVGGARNSYVAMYARSFPPFAEEEVFAASV